MAEVKTGVDLIAAERKQAKHYSRVFFLPMTNVTELPLCSNRRRQRLSG